MYATTTYQYQNQSIQQTTESLVKKQTRTIPDEEKDASYFEKRARNNQSAKRSRDTRRIREQQIQDRVQFLEQENSRLAMENQTIRYQISQFHTIYNGVTKPFS